jgi:hypothetical protein
MLHWFRVHASRIAIAAIASLAAVGVSASSPHEDDCHDAACRAMAVEHDASAHSIGAPPTATDAHPLHCLVCHWVRSFRPRTEAKILSTPAVETGTAVHVELFTAARSAQIAQPPLRSPPVFSGSVIT